MKKYLLNKKNVKRILITGLKYGFFVGLITIAFRYILMSNTDQIQGNILVMLSSFFALVVGQHLAFKYFNSKHYKKEVKFLPTLIVGLIFSLCIGGISGLTHFIEATYIDPNWSIKALEYSQSIWLVNNYSQDVISSQIELSTAFQTPVFWAIRVMCFFALVSFLIALMVTIYMKIVEELFLVRN
jgi:hypothetical protein